MTSISNSARLEQHYSNADYRIETEKGKYEEIIFLVSYVLFDTDGSSVGPNAYRKGCA